MTGTPWVHNSDLHRDITVNDGNTESPFRRTELLIGLTNSVTTSTPPVNKHSEKVTKM